MPDESRSRLARIAAWWRRGYDAELLTLAPATDERGEPLVWDFSRPVNRSPAWSLLRPWVLYPAIFVVAVLAIPFVVRHSLPPLTELAGRLVWGGLVGAILGTAIHRRQRPRTERKALTLYHRYRWRGTVAMDATIAAALAETRPGHVAEAPTSRER